MPWDAMTRMKTASGLMVGLVVVCSTATTACEDSKPAPDAGTDALPLGTTSAPPASATAATTQPRKSGPEVNEQTEASWALVAQSERARWVSLAGGGALLQDEQWLPFGVDGVERARTIPQPRNTASRLRVTGLSGRLDGPWVRFYYEWEGRPEDHGARWLAPSLVGYGGAVIDDESLRAWPVSDKLDVLAGAGFVALAEQGRRQPLELETPDEVATRCAGTLKPEAIGGRNGTVLIAGRCRFDANDDKRGAALLRVELVEQDEDPDAGAENEKPAFRLSALPLPAADAEDQVLAVELGPDGAGLVSLARRGAGDTAPPRVYFQRGDLVDSLRTPLKGPAVGLATIGNTLWMASPVDVVRTTQPKNPTEASVWDRLPRPTRDVAALKGVGDLRIEALGAVGEDVCVLVHFGQRLLCSNRRGDVAELRSIEGR